MRAYGRIGDNAIGRQLTSLLIKTVVADAAKSTRLSGVPSRTSPFGSAG